MALIFVTSNQGKADEARQILNTPVDIQPLDIDEIQSLDNEKIIRKKAEEAFRLIKKPFLVDDVSMDIEAWNGFPGPFTKYIDQAGGPELLVKMLVAEKNRTAIARATIAYHDGNAIHLFIGEVKGAIATEIRGTNGWGWDPVFIPEGYSQTFAEMTETEKNNCSHRRKALEKFKKYYA